jgi:opacity protein-like surface antigen
MTRLWAAEKPAIKEFTMKKVLKIGLAAALMSLAAPVAASAQQIDSLYVTPRLIYSYQLGDMSAAKWNQGAWSASALGGEAKDKVFGFGLAAGTDLGYSSGWPVRVEAEYVYRGKAEFGKGPSTVTWVDGSSRTAKNSFEVTAHSLMVNAFYDFNTATSFTPYLGLGLGGSYLDSSYQTSVVNGVSGSASVSKGSWNLAWNAGGGVAYHLSENAAVDFGYRYVNLGSADTGDVSMLGLSGSSEIDYTAHEFSIGLRLTGF